MCRSWPVRGAGSSSACALSGASGLRAYLEVARLQTAQLDLAMERWHRERKEIDMPLEAEDALRQRVIELRHWVPAA